MKGNAPVSTVRPFQALRPRPERAEEVASPPYDVLNTAEARVLAEDRPYSFLRVVRPELELEDGADPYSNEVYQRGSDNLRKFEEDGVLVREEAPAFYLYRQIMGDHQQTGLVALASCQEYDEEIIRKHEFTRPDKEADRVRHISTLAAQTGPVWLTYEAVTSIDELVTAQTSRVPDVDFVAPDGIGHQIWYVTDEAAIAQLQSDFAEQVELLYVADGHHRSAAASLVAKEWREKHGVGPEHLSQFFLTVLYPHNQLQILPYNRFVHDLNDRSRGEFFAQLQEDFEIEPRPEGENPSPPSALQFDMVLEKQWFRLTLKEGVLQTNDPVDSLDVSLLQERVLSRLLGIDDPRTAKRIEFIGGIRGHKELEKRVGEEGGVAFACYPTSIEQLLAVAAAKRVMPPKSTWFEPKLRSGLFVHKLER
jgi:uncharacterized protein (DUF1015 family)